MRPLCAVNEGHVTCQHGAKCKPTTTFPTYVGPVSRVLVEVIVEVGLAVVGSRAVRTSKSVPADILTPLKTPENSPG